MENDLLAKAEDLQLQNLRIPREVMGNITGLLTQEDVAKDADGATTAQCTDVRSVTYRSTLSASSFFMESEI